MKRLSLQSLDVLSHDVLRPGYKPRDHAIGIVHLGIGAFHRAHQAVYTDDVLAHHGGDWRILGVSLRSESVAKQLNPQDGLYAVNVRSAERSEYRVIGAVQRVLAARRDGGEVIEQMCSPATRIVSLTVTEKGYCHDPATGKLNASHPDIVADLSGEPVSALGFIVASIRERRARKVEPFTVLCCDNLPNNGPMLRGLVLQLGALIDDELSGWIEENVAFPATMVDRIVPATSESDRQDAAKAMRVEDRGLVVTEPFIQWVIEDYFCNDRPRWEQAGAEIVADVAPYELAKLRLLNGSHSSIAYLGYLSGYEYVHQAIDDVAIRQFIEYLMREEIAPTLTAPSGFDLVRYQRNLLARFENPALNHRTWQIAMDGSQKLPQRLLGTVRDRLRSGQSIAGISLAIAAWMRYVGGVDENGVQIDVQDPLADRLATAAGEHVDDPHAIVGSILGVSEVFDTDLRESTPFRESLVGAMRQLLQYGAKDTVRRFVAALPVETGTGNAEVIR